MYTLFKKTLDFGNDARKTAKGRGGVKAPVHYVYRPELENYLAKLMLASTDPKRGFGTISDQVRTNNIIPLMMVFKRDMFRGKTFGELFNMIGPQFGASNLYDALWHAGALAKTQPPYVQTYGKVLGGADFLNNTSKKIRKILDRFPFELKSEEYKHTEELLLRYPLRYQYGLPKVKKLRDNKIQLEYKPKIRRISQELMGVVSYDEDEPRILKGFGGVISAGGVFLDKRDVEYLRSEGILGEFPDIYMTVEFNQHTKKLDSDVTVVLKYNNKRMNVDFRGWEDSDKIDKLVLDPHNRALVNRTYIDIIYNCTMLKELIEEQIRDAPPQQTASPQYRQNNG